MSGGILITGGLGYLGGRIALGFLRRDRPLRLATRRPSGDWPAWTRSAQVVRADITETAGLSAICEDIGAVVHLAAPNYRAWAADPIEAATVNGVGTLRILEAAKAAGVERFVYISTIHVYGTPLSGRIDEQTPPCPRHPYAISHRTAEDYVLAAQAKGEIEGIVLRLSNGLGAPADLDVDCWTLLVNDLCRQAVTAKKLTLNTPGLQYRDFMPLDDVTRAVGHAVKMPAAALGDGLFNVGGGSSIQIYEMAQRVAVRCRAVLGFEPPVQRPGGVTGDPLAPLDFRMDKFKATGFEPGGDIDGEIDDLLRFCHQAFVSK